MTQQLGRYAVLGRLARGSTADIWLAVPNDTQLPRRVVLKQLYPHLADNDDFVRMFLDEVTLQARFAHPHIVRAFDLDDNDHGPFAALGLVDGPNAATALRLHKDPLPVDVVVRIGVAIASALHAASLVVDNSAPSEQATAAVNASAAAQALAHAKKRLLVCISCQ